MKLRDHFYGNKENQQADHIVSEPIIKCKSNWEPKKNHYTGETFVEVVENNVKNILQVNKELPRNNLCNIDRAAIDYCLKWEDIVISKVDKGGATVIMDLEECIRRTNQQFKELL